MELLNLVVSLLNLAILVGIAAFLVRLTGRLNPPEPPPEEHVPKTWDEKYEEEIDQLRSRRKSFSALLDIDPTPQPKIEELPFQTRLK